MCVERGRRLGFVSSQECVKSEESNLGNLTAGVKSTDATESESIKDKREFNRELGNGNLSQLKEKRMYGQFIREMPINKEKSDLEVETKALICAAQEQALGMD